MKSRSSEEDRKAFAAHTLSLTTSHLSVWAIDLALRLGVVEALRVEPLGLESTELAERLALDPEMTAALCRAAFTARLLEWDGKRYTLASGAEVLLDEDSSLYVRGLVGVALGLREQLERLREDIPAGRRSWWDQIGPEYLGAVSDTGRGFYTRLIDDVLPGFPRLQERLRSGGRALELGCGYGAGLIKMAQAFPDLILVGIDGDAHSLSRASERIAAADLSDRVSLRQQTFESDVTDGGFDFAYISISLHEARDRLAAVGHCFRALNAGGKLAVSEFPFPTDPAALREPAGGLLSLIQLHEVYFGAHHLTVQEVQDLLSEAGFTDVGAVLVTPLHVVHHGTRPA